MDEPPTDVDHLIAGDDETGGMPEEVLFETESRKTRADVADYLRTVADRLDDGEALTFRAGEETVTVDPPGAVDFEVKVEREGVADAPGELSAEFELEWDENGGETGDLAIE